MSIDMILRSKLRLSSIAKDVQKLSICVTKCIVVTVLSVCSVMTFAQTPGGDCSPFGAVTEYDSNGVLVCSKSGIWKPLVKAAPPSSFGPEAQVAATAGNRLANGMKAIIRAVEDEITAIFD